MRMQSQMFSSLKLHIMMQFQMSSSPYLLKLHIVMVVQCQVSYPYCPNLPILSMSIGQISHPIFDHGIKVEGNSIVKLTALKKDAPIISLISHQVRIDQVKHCTALKAIITLALFLARQGVAFRANTSNEVDETSDISGKKQVSMNIPSEDHETFNIDVFFIGLYETASMTGEFLLNVIKDALLHLDLNLDKLRGQCYDGGANMAGAKSGVKSRMLAEQPLALYINCAAHALNLALQDTSKSIPLVRNCLQWVNDTSVIVRDSPKRRAVFSQIATDHKLTSSGTRPLCPTRWTGVLNLYPDILDCLDTLVYDRSDIGPKARGLLDQLSQGNVLFGITITQMVFSLTDNLSTTLQSKPQTVTGAKAAVNVIIQCLKSKRSDIAFDGVWDEVEQKIKEMDITKPTLTTKIENTFKKVRGSPKSGCCTQKIGLNNLDLRNTSTWKSLLLVPGSVDEPTLTTISAFVIDVAKLKQEKEFTVQLIQTPKSVEDYVNGFKQMHPETNSLFSQFHVLLSFLVVVPATSSTAEWSLPMLRRIKTYLRSTMTQKCLNHLCVITSYPELLEAKNISKLMSEFINANSYRCQVFGKDWGGGGGNAPPPLGPAPLPIGLSSMFCGNGCFSQHTRFKCYKPFVMVINNDVLSFVN
ncbi:hypothetical protein PR048_002726 [Dryococelus australis]|uniref:DUF4371 domain-containing protein n=1 Tax=Dryococelus australis TaxID=614101 RepID=A0ABQ9IL00_9NEOP|nr:hypothetical protein PR048_002726 [Dryococelus australis]